MKYATCGRLDYYVSSKAPHVFIQKIEVLHQFIFP